MSPPVRTRIGLRGGSYVVVPGTPLGVWRKLVEPDLGLPHPRTEVKTTWLAFDEGKVVLNASAAVALYQLEGPA